MVWQSHRQMGQLVDQRRGNYRFVVRQVQLECRLRQRTASSNDLDRTIMISVAYPEGKRNQGQRDGHDKEGHDKN